MVFPVLPLYGENSPFFAVTGSGLLTLTGPKDVATIKTTLKQAPSNIIFSIDLVSTEVEIDHLLDLLNSGVSQLFVSSAIAAQLIEIGIPESRIGVKVDSIGEKIPQQSSLIAKASQPLGDLKAATNDGSRNVYLTYDSIPTLVQLTSAVASGLIPIVDGKYLTAGVETDKFSLADIFNSSLTTDRSDGLFTTLVVDTSGHALGLVYSSKESISEAIKTGTGVYQSRKRGLWYKGATSGATQKLVQLSTDCDGDCINFVVEQSGVGFCHLEQSTCFGNFGGLSALETTLKDRLANAPEGSYTKRLFNDAELLDAKIKEEAEELTEAKTKDEVSWEAADLFYFALTKCVKEGVSLADIERNLDFKSLKVTRRKGDAKAKFLTAKPVEPVKAAAPAPVVAETSSERIIMARVNVSKEKDSVVEAALTRPVQKTADIMKLVNPIIEAVRTRGDSALVELTAKFDGVTLPSPVMRAPFAPELMQLTPEMKAAIDLSIENVRKFHDAQLQKETLEVETSPGVICSRFARPVESVGLYIPGGTAVLPSTSLMLGVPAKVAGCKNIIFASPPRKDGTLTPEVVYVAHKVGAQAILLAGGAQAVAALAYGTESVPKVDKILGPGNQFVTAAKMYVQNDTTALCSIDMPAGPSEVLVIADGKADPDFVASDLLSQAEHGIDSQVILIAVDMTEEELNKVDEAVHTQALNLPRVEIVRKCIAHSTTLLVKDIKEAFAMSNRYAPEHLILQVENAASYVDLVDNAGSIFVGAYSPESCGDYSSGTNHTLPTYGYAKMYSGVNTATFQKFITSQNVTPEGLKNIGPAVMALAAVEGLDAHGYAVKVRMEKLGLL